MEWLASLKVQDADTVHRMHWIATTLDSQALEPTAHGTPRARDSMDYIDYIEAT